MGESLEDVRAELDRTLEAGMTAVLCVGEVERDPSGAYLSTIVAQLSSALDGLQVKPNKLIIAYEPVWAIGKTAADAMTGQDLREMTIFIKKTLAEHMDRMRALKIPILYGGAVEAENAAHLVKAGDVSGLLVGHASTDASSFLGILKAVTSKA
jgi:triosephosphate isomerase